jgi:hypothetical protein
MPGYRHCVTIGATACSALFAGFAAWTCFEVSPVLALFFTSLLVASVLFCFGCRWVLPLLVAGNLAFCTVACLLLVKTLRDNDIVSWPLLCAMVLAPGLATIACYLWGDSYCRGLAAALRQPSTRKRFRQTLTLTLAALGGLAGTFAYQRFAEYQAQQLEFSIARMPTGITATDADRLMGHRPDQISQVSGVLVDRIMLLAATNSKAAAYGAPQQYEVRLWQRGDVQACVVVDRDGHVAGRYIWRDK